MEQLPNAGERPAAQVETSRGHRTHDDVRLRFGEFELLSPSGELFKCAGSSRLRSIKLQHQPARVLLYLAECAGRLVSREELQAHLWGDDYFVDQEQGLNYCVRVLRKALGDSAVAPAFVETVPRQGYRFIAEVTVVEDASGRAPVAARPLDDPAPLSRRSPARGPGPAGRLLGLAIVGLLVGWILSRKRPD
jgi:DNA-binding winged helix-turn-helix (wHTH) protein